MEKRVSPLKSGSILLATYVVVYLITGFIGQVVLKLDNYEIFVEIIVALALLHILFHVYHVEMFNQENIQFGFICIAIGAVIVLLLNNDFSDFGKNISSLATIAFSTLGTALFEETIFRVTAIFLIGNIFYRSRYSLYWEVYLSSGIFALAHLINIFSVHQSVSQTAIQMLYAFCLGTVFAWSYLLTKNILYAFVLHFAADAFSALLSATDVTQVNLTMINIIYIVIMSLLILVFNWYLIQNKNLRVKG